MLKNSTKYNETTVRAICTGLKKGGTRTAAYLAAGIVKATFYNWLKDHEEFVERIERAEAERELMWLARIDAAMPDHWQAAAWKLERTNPRAYGKRVAMQIMDSEGQPLDPTEIRNRLATRLNALIDSDTAGSILIDAQY